MWTHLSLFPGGIAKAGVPQIFGVNPPRWSIKSKNNRWSNPPCSFPAPFGNLLELPTPFRFFALRHLGDEAAARQTIGDSVLGYYYDLDEPHRGWVAQLDQGIRQGGQAMGWFIGRFAAELFQHRIVAGLGLRPRNRQCRQRSRSACLTGLLQKPLRRHQHALQSVTVSTARSLVPCVAATAKAKRTCFRRWGIC
ncbi:MAG: hypothetical protein U0X75_19275 [Acidobacteriota bacterium]